MTSIDTDDLPALHCFVHGLRIDLPAIVAGLTLPRQQRTDPRPKHQGQIPESVF
jgi:hypothetical protein